MSGGRKISTDDYNAQTVVQYQETRARREAPEAEAVAEPSAAEGLREHYVPQEFLCPTSGTLLRDPVVLSSSGETCDPLLTFSDLLILAHRAFKMLTLTFQQHKHFLQQTFLG